MTSGDVSTGHALKAQVFAADIHSQSKIPIWPGTTTTSKQLLLFLLSKDLLVATKEFISETKRWWSSRAAWICKMQCFWDESRPRDEPKTLCPIQKSDSRILKDIQSPFFGLQKLKIFSDPVLRFSGRRNLSRCGLARCCPDGE